LLISSSREERRRGKGEKKERKAGKWKVEVDVESWWRLTTCKEEKKQNRTS
jgi:hypothetical protein